jgi:hypothetical protein
MPRGRKRAGVDGSRVRDTPTVLLRLPVGITARLRAVATVRGVTPSRIVLEALQEFFLELPSEDQRVVGTLARREAERLRERFPDAAE